MAISLVLLPSGSFLAARNRQKYIFVTDNYITNAGSAFVSFVTLNTLPIDGETIVYEIGTETITLTFKNSPTLDTHIQIGADTDETCANWSDVVQNQYYLFSNYVTDDSPGLSRVDHFAKEVGSAWDIDFSSSTADITAGASLGVNQVLEETFRFYLALYIFNGSYWESVLEVTAAPDTSQQAEYEIRDVLLSQLEYDLPIYGNTSVSQGSKSFKTFLLKYWEFYDDVFHNGGQLDSFHAHLGGYMEKETTVLDYEETYFTHATLQRFLTRHPRPSEGQLVTSTQHCFLYLYQKASLGDAKVYLLIEYTDGSPSTTVDPKYTINQPGSIVIIPAGYTQLNIDAHKNPGKDVARWYIQVYYGADFMGPDAITEGYLFTLDTNFYPNNRFFQFGNSVGGVEPLWCTGVAEYGLDPKGENYTVNEPENSATKIFGSGAQERSIIGRIITVNSGWMSRELVEYYTAELAASEEVYEHIDGQYVKILIDRGSIKDLYTDETEVHGFSFTYTYAQEDRV